ncbi:unnamed protein product [Pedinophyceae sp. YPF-701]|nr:unnamed protein product [Pedinophyceae sp. YPF-701]
MRLQVRGGLELPGQLRLAARASRAPARTQRRDVVCHARKSSLWALHAANEASIEFTSPVRVSGVHHVAVICDDLKRSLDFYQGVLGLELNPERPHDKLPYDGAWLWIGSEMIHLMELPNPDPTDSESRPTHGGRDRHFCIAVEDLDPLVQRLDRAEVQYTKSKSGRAAVFFRDPDMNTIEVVQLPGDWRGD